MVCPSLPGYGFSGKPTGTGWGVGEDRRGMGDADGPLGYDRYGAQGGDWGAAVTTQIGRNGGHCVAHPPEHADRATRQRRGRVG